MLNRRRFLASSITATGAALLTGACAGRGRLRGEPRSTAPSGDFIDENWTDLSRNRQIPVRLRVPTNPGPWPVVIYSHGLGGNREGGEAWGEAWQRAGYMVVHLQHHGSDSGILRSGPAGMREATRPEQATARVDDVRFALDEIARRRKMRSSEPNPWREADVDAIALAGHSFGAATTIRLAGETVGTNPPLFEPRLKAFIALSPGGNRNAPNAFSALRGPMLFITGTLDGDVVGNGETPASRQEPFLRAPPGNKYLLVLQDADHMTFAGNTHGQGARLFRDRNPNTEQLQPRHHLLVQTLTTQFLDAMLRGQQQARSMLANPALVKAPDVWMTK